MFLFSTCRPLLVRSTTQNTAYNNISNKFVHFIEIYYSNRQEAVDGDGHKRYYARMFSHIYLRISSFSLCARTRNCVKFTFIYLHIICAATNARIVNKTQNKKTTASSLSVCFVYISFDAIHKMNYIFIYVPLVAVNYSSK